MAKRTIVNVVKYLNECLKESGVHAERIIVFGSQVKGLAREDSDIDIAIISEDFRNKTFFKRIKMTVDAEVKTIEKFIVPLDIVTLTPEEFESSGSPIAGFARKGKVIIAA